MLANSGDLFVHSFLLIWGHAPGTLWQVSSHRHEASLLKSEQLFWIILWGGHIWYWDYYFEINACANLPFCHLGYVKWFVNFFINNQLWTWSSLVYFNSHHIVFLIWLNSESVTKQVEVWMQGSWTLNLNQRRAVERKLLILVLRAVPVSARREAGRLTDCLLFWASDAWHVLLPSVRSTALEKSCDRSRWPNCLMMTSTL